MTGTGGNAGKIRFRFQSNNANNTNTDRILCQYTALPEQAVRDIVASAFQSAGQRCSALRLLYVQDDIADALCQMLAGAMKALKVGNPRQLDSDVGPVIDAASKKRLDEHIADMKEKLIKVLGDKHYHLLDDCLAFLYAIQLGLQPKYFQKGITQLCLRTGMINRDKDDFYTFIGIEKVGDVWDWVFDEFLQEFINVNLPKSKYYKSQLKGRMKKFILFYNKKK